MRRNLLIIPLLAIATLTYTQQEETIYYGDQSNGEKAPFSKTVILNEDGSTTTEWKDIRKNKVWKSETFNGTEPFGVWIIQRGDAVTELDYNFTLHYSNVGCTDKIAGINDYFANNEDLDYIAPTISSGENTLYQFLHKNLVYPESAKISGTEGIVLLTFNISSAGEVEDIRIIRGVDIFLDKEAVRVLRQLKFSSPAALEGQDRSVCVVLPVKFKLL